MTENVESEVLNAEGMSISKLNNNLIKFFADSGASGYLTNEVESLSKVEKVEKVTKIKGVDRNSQADLEGKVQGVIKTKDSVGHIIKLKNVLYNRNLSRNLVFEKNGK